MKKIRFALTALNALCFVAIAVSAGDSGTLQFNDSTASAQILMKDGHAYVPVSAVAKLLNASVEVSGTTYKFIQLDNSRQVNGNEGKVREMVRLGYANVTVTSVDEGSSYKAKFGGSDFTADPGKKIVSVGLHVQNSTTKTQLCTVLGGDKTGLADTNGRSYSASSFSDFEARGPELLPGAAVDLVLIFNVPQDIELKDLVYEVNFSSITNLKAARIHLK